VVTGCGAELLIVDDRLKPEEAFSQAQRQVANEWFDHTLYSRLNDKQKGAIVLIMHRLHESLPSVLACRGHRGKVRRGARRQDPAANHRFTAAPPEIPAGIGYVSGLVPRSSARHAGPLRQLPAESRGQTHLSGVCGTDLCPSRVSNSRCARESEEVSADLIEVKADPDGLRQDCRRNRDLINDVSAERDREPACVRNGHS
jgi:hypothetical protein